ncbi:MAG: mechanosensitive ion channel [Gammaproteobacteria bacterium]|nr:mechanosensitive ion channel [Gammaproteobacteria bacterium]
MFEFLKQPAISISDNSYISWWQIILAIGLVVLAWFLSYSIAKFTGKKLSNASRIDKTTVAIIQKIIFFATLILVFLLILSFLDIPLTAFAFISGGVAIGLGFGAKNIIENFLSGWILMSERPIRIGDYIELDSSYGTVISIGNRSTIVKRIDGVHITIPNSQILESKIVNWSLIDPFVRTTVRVGVSYGSDVKLVDKLLLEICQEHPDLLQDPVPRIVFEDFGDNALIFDVFFWVSLKQGRELRLIRSELRHAINQKFNEHGVVIAFPQRDVHLHLDKGGPLFGDQQ